MTTVDEAGPGRGLGSRIRGVRLDRGLSTRELARRIGCSASLISQIERGATAPSAGILYLLASELGASLDYLFGVGPTTPAVPEKRHDLPLHRPAVRRREIAVRPAQPAGGPVVQRAGSRLCIELAGGVRWERLTPTSDPYVDFLQVHYEPRGGHTDQPAVALRHDGREYGLVLSGRLRARVGFDSHELGPGDSIAFDSSSPHVYSNETDEPVHAIWFIVHREPWRA